MVLGNSPGADTRDGKPLWRVNPCDSSRGEKFSFFNTQLGEPVCQQIWSYELAPPVPSQCGLNGSCEDASGGCWTEAVLADVDSVITSVVALAWVKSGPSCAPGHAYQYFGPCPSPSCPNRKCLLPVEIFSCTFITSHVPKVGAVGHVLTISSLL